MRLRGTDRDAKSKEIENRERETEIKKDREREREMRPSGHNCLPPYAALYFGVFKGRIQEARYFCRARVLRGREAAERVSFGAGSLIRAPRVS